MHLLLNPFGVDDPPCIVSHHHAFDLHFAGVPMHLHIGHPSSPSRPKTWPFAVRVTRIRHALALQPIALRHLLLGLCVRLPMGFVGRGLQNVFGAFIGQMRESVLQGIDAGRRGQFIDEAFMGKRIGQGRHTAQP